MFESKIVRVDGPFENDWALRFHDIQEAQRKDGWTPVGVVGSPDSNGAYLVFERPQPAVPEAVREVVVTLNRDLFKTFQTGRVTVDGRDLPVQGIYIEVDVNDPGCLWLAVAANRVKLALTDAPMPSLMKNAILPPMEDPAPGEAPPTLEETA